MVPPALPAVVVHDAETSTNGSSRSGRTRASPPGSAPPRLICIIGSRSRDCCRPVLLLHRAPGACLLPSARGIERASGRTGPARVDRCGRLRRRVDLSSRQPTTAPRPSLLSPTGLLRIEAQLLARPAPARQPLQAQQAGACPLPAAAPTAQGPWKNGGKKLFKTFGVHPTLLHAQDHD